MNNFFSYILKGTLLTTIKHKMLKPFFLSTKNCKGKQTKALNKMLEYATKNIPFYKDLRHVSSIESFPIVDKQVIKNNFNSFVSKKIKHYNYTNCCTGGSTGEPFKFLLSGGYEKDFNKRKWDSYGYKKGDVIFALDGTKIQESLVNNNCFWISTKTDDIPFGSVAVSSLYLNRDTSQHYLNFLNKSKPSFLRGYPSFIYKLAMFILESNFKNDYRLKGIELTSETVEDYQIHTIQLAFKCPVYLQYGHSEACVFGYTLDENYRYCIEPLYGYIEVLDVNNKHVKKGEIGEVVVTSLSNFAMPLIRYRTGDYAVFGGNDDRFVYLDKVIGRTQDYIIDRRGKPVLLTALIFGQHNQAMGDIVQWQIEQNYPGIICIKIIKGKGFNDESEAEILRHFEIIGNVDVTIDYVDYIEPTGRGKSKMLLQHLNVGDYK